MKSSFNFLLLYPLFFLYLIIVSGLLIMMFYSLKKQIIPIYGMVMKNSICRELMKCHFKLVFSLIAYPVIFLFLLWTFLPHG